ncbi:MAG: ribonuclease HI family protein [bacterium]
MAQAPDISLALRKIAEGYSIDEIWKQTGFSSKKSLAEEIRRLAQKLTPKVKVIVYADGASVGNPGDSGCAALVVDEQGNVLAEDYRYLGKNTNNYAEYQGVILGLKMALRIGAREVEMRLDSELLVNQIKGEYKVRSRNLAKQYQKVMELIRNFEGFKIVQVDRSQNKDADRLATLAISTRKRGDAEVG